MSFDYSGTKYVISQKTCFLKCWNANVRDYSLVRPTCGAQNHDSSQKSTSTTVIGAFYTAGPNFQMYHKNTPHFGRLEKANRKRTPSISIPGNGGPSARGALSEHEAFGKAQ